MQTPIISKGYDFLTGNMAQKGYLSVIDQVIVSGSNFFTGLILGRFVSPTEYGVFVLAWTTLMIALSLQNALVCMPMSVIGAQKSETESATYWGSLLIVQVVLGIGICLIILVGSVILKNISTLSISYQSFLPLISTTILSCFFFLGQEFFRRLLIIKLVLKDTLINDVVTHSIRVGGLLILLYAGTLNTVHSLLVISVSFVIGTAFGFYKLFNSIQISYARIRHDLLESWQFGKWVMAEMLPYTLSVQGYIYLTALFIGVQSTAALGASQNILNATNILILSFSNIMMPLAAKRFNTGGNKALTKLMTKVGILLAVPIVGFYLFTILFAEEILVFVYNQNYGGYGMLLIICSIYFIISYFNRILQIMLYAKKKPDIGFFAKMLSFVVMVVLAYPLIKYYGVYGAAVGTVISQIIILAGLSFYLTGTFKSEKSI
jgi:O-antigen/teichoic acid export membrane protein